MPPQTQNKFYSYVVGGKTYYDALPDTGNTPYGYTPITASQYLTGAQQSLSFYQALNDQGANTQEAIRNLQKGISLAQSVAPTATGAGQSGYITSPTTGAPQLASQYQADQAQAQAIASGQMVQIGTAANGQPLYAPKGTAATTPGLQATAQNPNPVAGGGTGFVGSPNINIPNVIPDSVLNYSGSKAGVLAAAQAKAPQVNLQQGQSGPEVKQLQEFLIGQGYQIPAGATGFFGDQTKAALTKFQEDQKVQAGQYFGYYGPKTIDAANNLQAAITKSLQGSTDPLSAGNSVLQSSGMNPLNITGPINAKDVPSVFTYYIQSMQRKQEQLDAAQKELDAAISAGNRGAIKTQGQLGVTMPLIGAELQRLKETVAYTTQPIQDQVDSLTRSLGMDKDMMNTIMAYGQYVQKLNEPEYHTVGNTLLRMYPDGRVERAYTGSQTMTAGEKSDARAKQEVSDISTKLLASRNQGAEADGVYADPNLYAQLRSQSTMSASDFDNRFGYLVNPASRSRLGVGTTAAGITAADQAIINDTKAAMKDADAGLIPGYTAAQIRARVIQEHPALATQL